MQKILVVGSSGNAKVVVDVLERTGLYEIAGYIDSFRPAGDHVLGYPVLGTEQDIPGLVREHSASGYIIAVGDNFSRGMLYQRIRKIAPELKLVTAVHPSASIARDVSMGAGCVVMAQAVINPGAQLGDLCMVNTSASLDHDCVMESCSSLGPNATTGGNCRIGEFTAICISATLKHGIKVGANSVVGAGATVLRDIPSHCVAYGTPAREVRSRKPSDPYL